MNYGKFSRRSNAVLTSIVVGIGAAALAFAPSAAAAIVEQYIEVPQCEPATGQTCAQTPTVNFSVDQETRLRPSFTANSNGCSDAEIRFSVDNYPQTDWLRVSPGQTVVSPTTFKRGGDHVLGVTARGIEGGCNTGILNAWGGVVRLEAVPESTLAVPTPGPSRTPFPFEPPFQIPMFEPPR